MIGRVGCDAVGIMMRGGRADTNHGPSSHRVADAVGCFPDHGLYVNVQRVKIRGGPAAKYP